MLWWSLDLIQFVHQNKILVFFLLFFRRCNSRNKGGKNERSDILLKRQKWKPNLTCSYELKESITREDNLYNFFFWMRKNKRKNFHFIKKWWNKNIIIFNKKLVLLLQPIINHTITIFINNLFLLNCALHQNGKWTL